jgi:hypothetical protein
MDMPLMKSALFTEAHRLQLRFDGFNIENRPRLQQPERGAHVSLVCENHLRRGGPILQVSAKYIF